MFSLRELLAYDEITIQCHDYPDADALASAYAVYTYMIENGKKAQIIYSGNAVISKPNLLKMLVLLEIPAIYDKDISDTQVLVMVDCQHGQSNVARINASKIYQIDHHEDTENGCDGIVRSALGSCSTLIWDLLHEVGFRIENYPSLATALYYGLFTDTSSFEEIYHPLDKDMRDQLIYDVSILNTLRFNNLTIDELNIAGLALTRYKTSIDSKFAVFHADECDQNILGFISDLAMQVENVDVCIVYNTLPNGYKLSIRSCTREVMANELARFLASGGGHKQKAGGFIPLDRIGSDTIDKFIWERMVEYYGSFDSVYADNHSLDISSMPMYIKKSLPVGYMPSTDVFAEGSYMLIRTLEGDFEVVASEDIYLMIGIQGEVYPIKADEFKKTYTLSNVTLNREYAYFPTVKNKVTGEIHKLDEYAKFCIPSGKTLIRAVPLTGNCKVFTHWTPDGYMFGESGDYIVVRADNTSDVYIIKQEIFKETYDAYEPLA